MVTASRALVRPRVLSPLTGEALLLEEELRDRLKRGALEPICLFGGTGAGKTTALAHLAHVLAAGEPVALLDDPRPTAVRARAERLVVYTTGQPPATPAGAAYELASWREDDLIEYLLQRDRGHCAMVMARLHRSKSAGLLAGNPELCSAVLESMVKDADLDSVDAALRAAVRARWSDPRQHRLARRSCLRPLLGREALQPVLDRWSCPAPAARLLRHRRVQTLLAAEQVATDLLAGRWQPYRVRPLPGDVIDATGALLREPSSRAAIEELLGRAPTFCQPLLASVLHAADADWAPAPGLLTVLTRARLRGVRWPAVHLPGRAMHGADFSRADLRGACLDDCVGKGASFRRARLRGATLNRFEGSGADFTGADSSSIQASRIELSDAVLVRTRLDEADLRYARLLRAQLRGASLIGADLTHAILRWADIEGADFRGAVLVAADLKRLKLRHAHFEGARFDRSNLSGCDLEGMSLPEASFSLCNLAHALLTASHMPGASFAGADLRHAGLAEVSWPGCDLGSADMTGASFHLGSSRSGHVDSAVPCEGSRTGFYTDELHEQAYRAPEEIRKADLRGADLRGAVLDGVDFYLVDLRGARYDAARAAWLRQTGAIL